MYLGLDIGGTKIAGVLIEANGAVRGRNWTAHSARGAEPVSAALVAAARDLLAQTGVAGSEVVLGVSVAGLVGQSGLVTHAASLLIYHDDLAARLTAELGCPATVVNDADATLLAAAAGDPDGPVDDAVLLALGTGVGGAVLSGGRLIQGPTGYATELGHLPVVDPLDYPCVCGSSGCLEQLASGRGLGERVRASAQAATVADFAGITVDRLTSIHVITAARAGVAPAVRLVQDAAQAIGHALALLTVTVEPTVLYLGGSLAHAAGDLLIPDITTRLLRQLPFAAVRRPPRIRLDDVGPTAAALGAARLAGTRLTTTRLTTTRLTTTPLERSAHHAGSPAPEEKLRD